MIYQGTTPTQPPSPLITPPCIYSILEGKKDESIGTNAVSPCKFYELNVTFGNKFVGLEYNKFLNNDDQENKYMLHFNKGSATKTPSPSKRTLRTPTYRTPSPSKRTLRTPTYRTPGPSSEKRYTPHETPKSRANTPKIDHTSTMTNPTNNIHKKRFCSICKVSCNEITVSLNIGRLSREARKIFNHYVSNCKQCPFCKKNYKKLKKDYSYNFSHTALCGLNKFIETFTINDDGLVSDDLVIFYYILRWYYITLIQDKKSLFKHSKNSPFNEYKKNFQTTNLIS